MGSSEVTIPPPPPGFIPEEDYENNSGMSASIPPPPPGFVPESDAQGLTEHGIEGGRVRDLRSTVKLPEEDITAPPPAGREGIIGGLEEAGRGLVRSGMVAIPEMVGKAAEYFDPEGGSTAVRDFGIGLQEGAHDWLQENPEYKQSLTARQKKEEDAFSVHGSAGEAMEMLGPSVGGTAAGAGIGAAVGGLLGSVVPGPGTVAGAVGGAKLGAWLGTAAGLGGFFGSAAQDTEEKVFKAQMKKLTDGGMSEIEAEPQAMEIAKEAGLKSGTIEAGGELIARIPLFRVMRLLPKKTKNNAIKAATDVMRKPGALASDLLKVIGAEVGTELAQSAGQQYVEAEAGAGEMPTWDSTKGVIMPTAIMSALTMGIAEPIGMAQRRELTRTLADAEAAPEARIQAVETVAGSIKDPELAQMWRTHSAEQIKADAPIVAQEDVFYAEDQIARKAKEQGVPSPTEDPQPQPAIQPEAQPIGIGGLEILGLPPADIAATTDDQQRIQQRFQLGRLADPEKQLPVAGPLFVTPEGVAGSHRDLQRADAAEEERKRALGITPGTEREAAKRAERGDTGAAVKRKKDQRLIARAEKMRDAEKKPAANELRKLAKNVPENHPAADVLREIERGRKLQSKLVFAQPEERADETQSARTEADDRGQDQAQDRADRRPEGKAEEGADRRGGGQAADEVIRTTKGGKLIESEGSARRIRSNRKIPDWEIRPSEDGKTFEIHPPRETAPESVPDVPAETEEVTDTEPLDVKQKEDVSTVTVRREIPANELSTEGLVDKIKAESPSGTAGELYGRFVQLRNLKPEIDAKTFGRMLESAVPNRQVEVKAVDFVPTHKQKNTGRLVQVTELSDGRKELVFDDGSTGAEPADKYREEKYKFANQYDEIEEVSDAEEQTPEAGKPATLPGVSTVAAPAEARGREPAGEQPEAANAKSLEDTGGLKAVARNAKNFSDFQGWLRGRFAADGRKFAQSEQAKQIWGARNEEEAAEGADEGVGGRSSGARRDDSDVDEDITEDGNGPGKSGETGARTAESDTGRAGSVRPESVGTEGEGATDDGGGAGVTAQEEEGVDPWDEGLTFDAETIEQHPMLQSPEIMEEIRYMADQAGWAERGGRALDVEKRGQESTGRTEWIPRAEWFKQKPEGVTERHFKGAVERLNSGKKLTKPQREALQFMLIHIEEKRSSEWEVSGIDEFDNLDGFDKDLTALALELDEAKPGAGEAILESAAKRDLSNAEIRAEIEAAISAWHTESTTVVEAGQGEEFGLEAQTEEQAQQAAAEEERRKELEAEEGRKAKADQERGDFVLSGSSRAADEGAARGQENFFDAIEEALSDYGDTGGVQDRGGRSKVPANQLAFNLEPAAEVSTEKKQLGDTFLAHYKLAQTGELRSGVDRVERGSDAAHVLAPIRKHGQELFFSLVLDGQLKPIAAIRHTKGARDAASVYPNEVASAVAAIPKAKSVWFGHNHPSGVTNPSAADVNITNKIIEVLDGSGITVAGHVVLGRGQKAHVIGDAIGGEREITVIPKARRNKVAIKETMARRLPQGKRVAFTSPEAAKKYISEIDTDNGLVLLDNKHKVVGVLSLTAGEMSRLRDGKTIKRVLKAIHDTNAAAGAIVSEDVSAAANLAGFLNKGGHVRVLDAFILSGTNKEIVSSAEKGWAAHTRRDGFRSMGKPESKRVLGPKDELMTELRRQLGEEFGKARIARLEKQGKLKIHYKAGDMPGGGKYSDVQGMFIDGVMHINAENTSNVADGLAAAVLSHEATHAGERGEGRTKEVIGVNFDKLHGQLSALRDKGDVTAVAAFDRVPGDTPSADIASEQIAYFVEQAYEQVQLGKAGNLSARAKNLYRRIVAAVRAWYLNTAVGRGKDFRLTDELAVALVKQSLGRAGGGRGGLSLQARKLSEEPLEDFTYRDGDDNYYYHVTSDYAAKGIRKNGLLPEMGGSMFGQGVYGTRSRGKVYLTKRAKVKAWSDRIEDMLFDKYDDPPGMVVFKIKKSDVSDAVKDDLGSDDVGESVYVDRPLRSRASTAGAKPTELEDAAKEWREKGTDSKYFREWFKDSKVVGEDGEPLVVYHGGAGNVVEFRKKMLGTNTGAPSAKGGFFFTSSTRNAEEYAGGDAASRSVRSASGIVAEWPKADQDKYYAAVQYRDSLKPKGTRTDDWMSSEEWVSRNKKVSALFDKFLDKNEAGYNIMPVYLSAQKPLVYDMQGREYRERSYNDLIKEAKRKRRDGVIIRNTYDPEFGDVYVVFKPTQIKSAVGNRGTFDPDNPDIRYSRGRKKVEEPEGFEDFTSDELDIVRSTLPNRTTKAKLADAVSTLTDNWKDKVNQGVFDKYWSLKKLDTDAHKLAHLIPSSSGTLEAMLDYGLPTIDNRGVLGLKTTAEERKQDKAPDRGLIKTLSQLGNEVDRFFLWVAANRADSINKRAKAARSRAGRLKVSMADTRKEITRLTNEGGQGTAVRAAKKRLDEMASQRKEALKKADITERFMSDERLDLFLRSNQGKMKDGQDRKKRYNKVWREFQEFNESVLDIANKTGLISQEQRDIYRNEFYVPFYRVMEEQGTAQGPSAANQLVRQQAWKKYKGSARQLGDLFGNTLMNWNHLLAASLRNQAGVKALKSAVDAGIAKKVGKNPKARSKNAVYVKERGEEVWYEVDAENAQVLESLQMLNMEGMNTLTMRSARKVKRLFTEMVTSTPSFRAANIFRDSIMAPAVNQMSKNIWNNVMKGYKETSKESLNRASMLASGAEVHFGHVLGHDTEAQKEMIRKKVNPLHVLDNPNAFKSLYKVSKAAWDQWQEVGSRAENINRAAAYMENLRTSGGDTLESAYLSRDIMDFTRHGAWKATRVLIDTVPFLNARLQGLHKLGRSAADPRIMRKQFAPVVGTYVMAGVLLYLSNMNDEDFRDEEEWLKDAYHVIKIPGSDIDFKLPKPFEIGAIETVAERLAEQIVDDKVHGKLFWTRMMHLLGDTLALDPRPQIVKPMLEVAANKDSFTERPIESLGMQNLPVTQRRKEWTSSFAVGMSHMLDQIPWDKVKLSPVQVDHMIRGYFGAVGTSVAQYLDFLVLDAATGKPSDPAWRVQQHPGYGRFFKTGPIRRMKYGEQFYDQLTELRKYHSGIRAAKLNKDFDLAKEIKGENREKLRWRKRYNRAQRRISAIRANIKRVRQSDLDREAKRTEDEALNAKINQIQKRIVLASREAWE